MYKKISRIKYNNKVFDIFSDENHNKTFLEVRNIDNVEKYYYLNAKDYIYLDKVYNHPDISILYSKNYNFRKVFVIGGTILVTFCYGISLSNTKVSMQRDNKYSTVSEVDENEVIETSGMLECNDIDTNIIEITDVKQLDAYGINPVTFDDVRNTLEQNKEIPDKYRQYISEFIDVLDERLPLIDLRPFNENLKKLKIEVIPTEEWTREYAAAYFNRKNSTITLKDEYDSKEREKAIITHELVHSTRSVYIELPNSEKVITMQFCDQYGYGTSIGEAFTDICTDYLLCDDYESFYDAESRCESNYEYSPYIFQVLKYSKEYNLYDFYNYDIYKFEKVLEKYGVEELIDIYDIHNINKKNDTINEENIDIMDEYNNKLLLEICKKKIQNGESELSVYNLLGPSNADMFMEIYNSVPMGDDWTFRVIRESQLVSKTILIKDADGEYFEEEVASLEPKVSLYYNDNIVYDGLSDSIFFITVYEDNLPTHSVVKKQNDKYYDVITKKEIDPKTISCFNILDSDFLGCYDTAINLNTVMSLEGYEQFYNIAIKSYAPDGQIYEGDVPIYGPEYEDPKTMK